MNTHNDFSSSMPIGFQLEAGAEQAEKRMGKIGNMT